MNPVPRRGGLALILVAGVLGILAVLAAAFVTMAQLERKASLQRLYATKAQLLARSGLEDAVARLTAGQDASLASSRYGGEDFDGSGTLSMMESDYEVVGPNVLDVETCPAKQAMRPSFFRKDTFGTLPDLVWVEGRQRGYTGQLQGDLGGNLYALKVEDESGKINVNGGFLDGGDRDGDGPDYKDTAVRGPGGAMAIGRGWNAQLTRILTILGSQPEVGVANLGTLVVTNRPLGGYRSIAELQQLIGVSPATKDLSPWLTVSSWIDAKVVHPNGYAGQPAVFALSDVKKGRLPLQLEEAGRPPVNLNAAGRPVLRALLTNLQGMTWVHPGFPQTYTINAAMASSLADALVAARPFGSWNDFGAFVDGLVPSVIQGMNVSADGGGNLCGADLVKASLDPNTMSNKELPDQLRWRWVDKSDLTVWSTEGNLGPTGTFKVSTVGRVLDGRGKVLAEASAGALVQAFSLLRQTSQKDFVGGRTSLQGYLSLADPVLSLDATTGATANAAWWGPMGSPGRGLAAMTYPCLPSALQGGNAAEFDGAIGLATVQVPEGPPSVDPTSAPPAFVHHFDDAWDADAPAGIPSRTTRLVPPAPGSGLNDGSIQADLTQSVWPSPAGEPSTIYPDGLHVQEGRSPAFQSVGNIPLTATTDPYFDSHPAFSYWVKPVITLGHGTGGWKYDPAIDSQWTFDFTCVRFGTNSTHALMIGREVNRWGMIAENGAPANVLIDPVPPPPPPPPAPPPPGPERWACAWDTASSSFYLPGCRWFLVTVTVDMAALDEMNADIHFTGVRGESQPFGGFMASVYSYPFDYRASENLAASGVPMVLGGQYSTGIMTPYGRLTYGNQILDEFAIYDFSGGSFGAGLAEKNLNDAWSLLRYKVGRYYKQEAVYLSAPIQPDPGKPVRLLRAGWTAYLPKETRKELRPPLTPDALIWPSTNPIPATGVDRPVDPLLLDSTVTLELVGEGGTLTSPVLAPLSQGGKVILAPLPGFCYRLRILPRLPGNPDDNPVLETPFLDDITFAWQGMGGPRYASWDR